jgi:hypothetical protein
MDNNLFSRPVSDGLDYSSEYEILFTVAPNLLRHVLEALTQKNIMDCPIINLLKEAAQSPTSPKASNVSPRSLLLSVNDSEFAKISLYISHVAPPLLFLNLKHCPSPLMGYFSGLMVSLLRQNHVRDLISKLWNHCAIPKVETNGELADGNSSETMQEWMDIVKQRHNIDFFDYLHIDDQYTSVKRFTDHTMKISRLSNKLNEMVIVKTHSLIFSKSQELDHILFRGELVMLVFALAQSCIDDSQIQQLSYQDIVGDKQRRFYKFLELLSGKQSSIDHNTLQPTEYDEEQKQSTTNEFIAALGKQNTETSLPTSPLSALSTLPSEIDIAVRYNESESDTFMIPKASSQSPPLKSKRDHGACNYNHLNENLNSSMNSLFSFSTAKLQPYLTDDRSLRDILILLIHFPQNAPSLTPWDIISLFQNEALRLQDFKKDEAENLIENSLTKDDQLPNSGSRNQDSILSNDTSKLLSRIFRKFCKRYKIHADNLTWFFSSFYQKRKDVAYVASLSLDHNKSFSSYCSMEINKEMVDGMDSNGEGNVMRGEVQSVLRRKIYDLILHPDSITLLRANSDLIAFEYLR